MSEKMQDVYSIVTDLMIDLAAAFEAKVKPGTPIFLISDNLNITLTITNKNHDEEV